MAGSTLLKVGRVQSPTLAMIVERDREVEQFKPEPYYMIKLKTDSFTAISDHFKDKGMAEASLKLTKNSIAKVVSVTQESKKSNPPKLYDLTSLQRDANRMFGITAKDTLDTAQILYEKKLITYPRTDSKYLAEDMKETAEDVIYIIYETIIKGDINPAVPDVKKLLNTAKVSDYHAIIPTSEILKFDTNILPELERKILYLMAFRLLEAASEPCEYTIQKAELMINDLTFKTSKKHVDKAGYTEYEDLLREIFRAKKEDEESIDEGDLMDLREGQEIDDYVTCVSEGKTKPPKRFTEDTLLSAMEKAGADMVDKDAERKGIGTPATRAGIIEKLVYDKYVKRKKKCLISTDLGRKLVEILALCD